MLDLFAPDPACPVCGELDCASKHLPEFRLPRTRDRALVPHVVAPHDVFSDPDPETGAGVKLIAAGDPVTPEVAARYGWTARVVDPTTKPPRRRRPPAPRAETVA